MKGLALAAPACLAAVALAAVAVAQTYNLPVLTFDGSATPVKAGTKKKPKATKIRLDLAIPKNARVTADQIVFNLPRHLRVTGRGFRYCPATELDTTRNPNRCPKGSKVGSGTATAVFGRNLSAINFRLTAFAGSRTELGIWMQSSNLPLARAMRAVISRAGSPYHQKLTIDIPPQLQRHLGAYVHLTGFKATIGATRGAKGRKRRSLVTSVGCPGDDRHRWEARVRFVPNPNPPIQGEASKGDTSACR